MTFQSERIGMSPKERADYGFARVRDIAFDAIQALWRRRRSEGMKQTDIVRAIGRHPAWVSRNMRAPGNWTLRTVGELAEALGGEVEIRIRPIEEATREGKNYDAYDEFPNPPPKIDFPPVREPSNQEVSKQPLPGSAKAGQVVKS